jgi:hypothetical protein
MYNFLKCWNVIKLFIEDSELSDFPKNYKMQLVPKAKIFVLPEDKISSSDSYKSGESDDEEAKNKITIKMRPASKCSRKGSEDIMLVSGWFSNTGSRTPFKPSFKSLAVFGGTQIDQEYHIPNFGQTNLEIKLDTVNEDRNDNSIQPDCPQENEYQNNFKSGYKMIENLPQKSSGECNISEISDEGEIDRNWVYNFNPNNNKELFDRVVCRSNRKYH